MAIDLTPVRGLKQTIDLAFFQGSLGNVFKIRRIRKRIRAGDIAGAKRIIEEVNQTNTWTRNDLGDEAAMMVHHGALLYRLGGMEAAVTEYLLPAARRFIDGSAILRARLLLESLDKAGIDSPEVQSLLDRVRS